MPPAKAVIEQNLQRWRQPPPGLHRVRGDVVAAGGGRQFAAGSGSLGKVRLVGSTVEAGQPTALDVVEHPRPEPFCIADHDGVEMLGGFLGAEGGVKAAGDHNLAAAAEFVGDFVGPRRQRRHKRDADHVARRVEIQRLDVFVADRHLVVPRRQRGDGRQREYAEPQHLPFRHAVVGDSQVLGSRQDE